MESKHEPKEQQIPAVKWNKNEVFRRILIRIEESEKNKKKESVRIVSTLTKEISNALTGDNLKN